MRNALNVAVVGGGPCGSFAAYNLAKLGWNVTVFEEHEEIGVPSHCAGHLSIRGLKNLGQYPLPEKVVENTPCGAIFHSPLGREFSVRHSSPVTCTVNRTLFDKHLAEKAMRAGAHYHLNSRAESLIMEEGAVKGVTVRQGGKIEDFRARLVIDAEGISSRILKQASLPTFNRSTLVNAVHAEVEKVKDVESDMVEVFLGKGYSPGFYGWLIPKGNGEAKVGLATNSGNPKELLQKLMVKHPSASRKLGKAKIQRIAFHPITLGGPISRSYLDGFLVVGDAASQVKPTTGGGVIFGLTCARIAAGVASEGLRENDFSSEFLSEYQRRCKEVLGLDVRVMLRMRKLLDAMSDRSLDNAIGLCNRISLDKTFRGVEDIDFQGQSLLRVLRSPRMLAALGYFFYIYLSANP
jgi:digeranylgeranylglycerophospholipid reductase